MINYTIEDKDGNQFTLNDASISQPARNSVSYLEDIFEYDTKTIENSFLPGSIKIGSIRLIGRILTFELSRADNNQDAYKSAVNTLISKLQNIKYLIDDTNSKRILVVLSSISVSYDAGSLHHSSNDSFILECLTPYWEDLVEQSQIEVILGNIPNLISFNNDGFLSLLPIFELTVTDLCPFVNIRIGEQTIRIEDSIFGNTNNKIMEINNYEGVIINNNVDRTEQIVSGLGFVSISVGLNTIEINTPISADLNIKYRRRYYV